MPPSGSARVLAPALHSVEEPHRLLLALCCVHGLAHLPRLQQARALQRRQQVHLRVEGLRGQGWWMQAVPLVRMRQAGNDVCSNGGKLAS